MSLTVSEEQGVRIVRNADGYIVLREGETRTPIQGQPMRDRVRKFRNDILIMPSHGEPWQPGLGSFFNDAPHVEREVESVHEEAGIVDGRPLTGKHVAPPTTPVYGRYVREHPFVGVIPLLVGPPETLLLGTLVTVGYSLPDGYLPGQPKPEGGLEPQDTYGQIIVPDRRVVSDVSDWIKKLAASGHPQFHTHRHDDFSTTYVAHGDDGEFGQQSLQCFGRSIEAMYRKLSLDCNEGGLPRKLTIHFRWSGPMKAPDIAAASQTHI